MISLLGNLRIPGESLPWPLVNSNGLFESGLDVGVNGLLFLFGHVLQEVPHHHLVERQPHDGGDRLAVRVGEEVGILGKGVLVPGLQGVEVGMNLRVESGGFRKAELRVSLPGSNSSGFLGLVQNREWNGVGGFGRWNALVALVVTKPIDQPLEEG